MKFKIPQQNAATKESSPSNPRKLKKVLSTLPNTNMGELTKQTFHILRDQNRQVMPNKDRLENLEMIRVLTRGIFNNLKKYFINRTLPLPDKSQKIINLNQSILLELILGYKIIASEASNESGDKINDKTLAIAICRAINYLSEMLLRASEIYEPCPKNLWRDAHQLYVLAETNKLLDVVVHDQERETEKTTIANSYKQILLFALARPTALRQSDNDRIYKELFNWSQLATITSAASEEMIDCCFCMQVNKDIAPGYLRQENISADSSIRILDTKELVSHVANLVAQQDKEKQKLAIGETIPLETLTMLIHSWGESPKRKFSRADRHGHINIAIGLSQICKAMGEHHETHIQPSTKDKYSFAQTANTAYDTPIDSRHDFFQAPEFHTNSDEANLPPAAAEEPDYTLESIDNGIIQEDVKRSVLDLDNGENAWDMVAKGRALTQAYENKQQHIEEHIEPQKQHTDTHWQLVNISAGGYCLRWNSDNTSKAQIGELIALQEFDAGHQIKWHIGVIRWMQFTHEDGLEIGVQILSPHVASATAQRNNRLDEAPFECLMVPAIKALNQASSVLLPSHAFKTNAKLIIRVFEHKLNITLGKTTEHTGSFTQFSYNNTDLDQRIKKQAKKDDATKHMDDFDELWSTL